MSKNNKINNSAIGFKYYFSIGLSVVAIIGVIAGVMMVLGITPNIFSLRTGSSFTDPTTLAQNKTIIKIIGGVIIAVCGIISVVIVPIRQKLRDEFEYDENGVSKKHGQFSQLSKEQRDAIDQQKMMDMERILSSTNLRKITHTGSKDPDTEMKNLIGMMNVKRDMHEMFSRIVYEIQKQEDANKGKRKKSIDISTLSSTHMVFYGNPGTGKTTVARIITGFLYQTGYIKKNQIIEIDGNFLTGMTPGESTKKTSAIIMKALGGVLFIDEAYALLNDSCSQEILATLIKEMEDRRGEFVLIMAGYDKEMKKLIASNPGFESRIKRYLYFENYTINELQQIFISLAGKEGFNISSEIMNLFIDRIAYESKQPNFGNARTVRNIIDKIIDRHAVNLMDGVDTPEEKYILTQYDMPEIDTHKHI